MDPVSVIGLAASVQQLAGFTVTVVGKLYAYYGDVSKAPEQAEKLREELRASILLINALEDTLGKKNPEDVARDRPTLSATVTQFKQMLEQFDERVQINKTKGFKRLVWPFNKKENADFISRIERYKSAFILALDIQHIYIPK